MANEDDIDSFWEGLRPKDTPQPNPIDEEGAEKAITELESWMIQQRERAGQLAQDLIPFIRRIEPAPEAPVGSFEDRVLIRSQQMVDDVIRRIPPTRENMSFLTRVTDELRLNLVQYASRPGATMEAIEEFIREELVPLEALASGAVNLQAVRITVPDSVINAVRQEIFSFLQSGRNTLSEEDLAMTVRLAIRNELENLYTNRVSQAIRQQLGRGLTTEELLARVMNQVEPGGHPQRDPLNPTLEEARELVQRGLWEPQDQLVAPQGDSITNLIGQELAEFQRNFRDTVNSPEPAVMRALLYTDPGEVDAQSEETTNGRRRRY